MQTKHQFMESYLNKITINPDICNGKPTIRGMRITVKTILEYLAAGESIENILNAYPILEKEDISAALQYASTILDKNLSSSPQLIREILIGMGELNKGNVSEYHFG
jgi:uncharacterized protein (DUF433 family)